MIRQPTMVTSVQKQIEFAQWGIIGKLLIHKRKVIPQKYGTCE